MWLRVAIFGCLTLNAFGQFLSERWIAGNETYVVTVNSQAVRIGQVHTGAAYSAMVTWERVRTLGDGTHLTWPATVTRVWRDSAGRTRTETAKPGELETDTGGRYIMTEISDPVGRMFYILDDEVRTAYRFAAAMGKVEPAAPRPEVTRTPMDRVTEKLGSRNIEGVMAEGTKETRTIPIGAIGNDRPLVSTSEEWYSPELKREVLAIFSDPRNGETVRRTTGISRVEPDASWFAPPLGYAVVDGKGSVRIVLKRR